MPMPQFRKIDGVLANEMPLNMNDFNSAIAAINQAIDRNSTDSEFLAVLQNPMAKLVSIQPQHSEKYKMIIAAEKREKTERAGIQNTVVPLEHNEIQGLINSMNRLLTLQKVEDMVNCQNESGLLDAIENLRPDIGVPPRENLSKSALLGSLSSTLQNRGTLRLQDIESALKAANISKGHNLIISPLMKFDDTDDTLSIIKGINQALENGDISELLKLLRSSCLGLGEEFVHPFAGSLYFAELDYIRRKSATDLRKEGIVQVCKFLSTVAKINEAAQSKNFEHVYHLATREGVNLEDLKEEMKMRYGEAMHTALVAKQKLSMVSLQKAENGIGCKLLNHADIQDCIDMVNSEEVDYKKIEAVKLVNEAVRSLDHLQLFRALQNPNLELEKNFELRHQHMNSPNSRGDRKFHYSNERGLINEEDSLHYLCLLRDVQRDRSLLRERQDKPTISGDGADVIHSGHLCELWMEDILEAVEISLSNVNEAKSAAFNLSILNMAIMQRDADHTYAVLCKDDLNLKLNGLVLYDDRKLEYTDELYKIANLKEESGANGAWVEHKLSNNGHNVTVLYLNLKDHKHAWKKPREYNGPRMSSYVGQEEIIFTLNRINQRAYGTILPPNFDMQVWTKFQARCRGNLVRRKLFKMLHHYYENEQKIVIIQAYWRGKLQRNKISKMMQGKVRSTIAILQNEIFRCVYFYN